MMHAHGDTMMADSTADVGESNAGIMVTHDLEEAQHIVTDVYSAHNLESKDGQPLDFKLRHVASERLTIGRLSYGADAELFVPPMLACSQMTQPLSGKTMGRQHGDQAMVYGQRGGIMFSPTDPLTVRWSPETVQFAVKFQRRSLADHLSDLINRPVERPVQFDLAVDLTTAVGQALLASVTFFQQEMCRPGGIATMQMARAELESLVMTQTLLAIPNSFSDLLHAHEPQAPRSKVQLAIEIIEANPDSNLSVSDMAKAAGVTARALQRGFKDEVGVAPATFVRSVRLDRVHADLLESAGLISVTDIAMRWGFFHLGRFAQQYHERFGVLPSETARRLPRQGP